VKERDLQRGFLLTYILLAALFWLVSLAVLVFLAHRISQPIQSLTAGLTQLAGGDLNARVPASRDDEVGSRFKPSTAWRRACKPPRNGW